MVTYYENEGILFSNDLFGQYTGAEPPVDIQLSENEIIEAAAGYFDKVFTSATLEERRVVFTLTTKNLNTIAPGHGVILQKHKDCVLDFYRSACK